MKTIVVALVLILSELAFGWSRTDTMKVLATNDDVRLVGSDFSQTGTLYRGYLADNGRVSVAERMMSLVPAGQTITSATYVVAAANRSGTDTTKLYMEYANNAAAITSTADFNGRTLTTDSIDWTIPGTWTEGTRYTWTITSLFTAVYNAGYADSGEYCNVFTFGRNLANASHYRTSYAYDQGTSTTSWIIVVHETATSSGSNRRRFNQLQQSAIDRRFPIYSQWEERIE